MFGSGGFLASSSTDSFGSVRGQLGCILGFLKSLCCFFYSCQLLKHLISIEWLDQHMLTAVSELLLVNYGPFRVKYTIIQGVLEGGAYRH